MNTLEKIINFGIVIAAFVVGVVAYLTNQNIVGFIIFIIFCFVGGIHLGLVLYELKKEKE